MAFTRPRASQINFDATNISDSLIRINSSETGANTNDIGIVFERGSHTNAALVFDESADAFRLISTTHSGDGDTTDINISAHHDLHVGGLTASSITIGATAVTATAAELNYIDGVTSAIQTQLDAKLALAGGTMSGAIAMGTNKITGMGDPTANQDAATKAYVDTQTSSIVTTTDIAGDTGTDTVTLGSDTLTFSGTANEITTAVTDNTVTISLPDDVTIGSDLTVTGNLTVNGTTTTISTTNSIVSDSLIELNTGAASNANDLGIVMERGSTGDNAIIAWDESADKFIVGTTTATGASTGDLTITTGTLVANIEGNVTGDVTGNADTATALATARNIAGNSFDGTGDITIASTDLSDTSNLVRNNQNNTITSTTAGGSAAPEFELFRDITGADANYIGQIKFSADNDADQKTVFAKITGKIGDASDGSEDGIIEIAHQKAGSQNIGIRITSTEFKIMNSMDFDVETHDGSSTGLRLANTLVTATAAELNYVDGVTSNIQTQLDAKAPTADPTFTGTLTYATLNDGTTALTSTVAEINKLDGMSGTAVGTTDTQTLTNKTLTAPVISTISNAGTLTLPTSTDTLVGRATTDTLTNKTLTSPQVNTNIDLLAQADLRLYDADSSNYVGFQAPATATGNILWTLPGSDGTEGQVLSTNGGGTLAWEDASAGGGSGSSYPNSTFSTVPGTDGNFDMSKNVAQTTQETPFEASGTDAFGVNLGSVFSLMDPVGSIETIDYGDSEAYVGA